MTSSYDGLIHLVLRQVGYDICCTDNQSQERSPPSEGGRRMDSRPPHGHHAVGLTVQSGYLILAHAIMGREV